MCVHFFSLVNQVQFVYRRENDTDSQYKMNDVVDDKTYKLIVVWRLVNQSIDNTIVFFFRWSEAIRDG